MTSACAEMLFFRNNGGKRGAKYRNVRNHGAERSMVKNIPTDVISTLQRFEKKVDTMCQKAAYGEI